MNKGKQEYKQEHPVFYFIFLFNLELRLSKRQPSSNCRRCREHARAFREREKRFPSNDRTRFISSSTFCLRNNQVVIVGDLQSLPGLTDREELTRRNMDFLF